MERILIEVKLPAYGEEERRVIYLNESAIGFLPIKESKLLLREIEDTITKYMIAKGTMLSNRPIKRERKDDTTPLEEI